MEFFVLVASKMQDGQQLKLTIRKNGERLVVSMIPDTKGINDKSVSSLEPLVMNGTPQEFEEQFEQALAPVGKAFSLLCEVSDFEKKVEEARKQSEMEAKKKKEAGEQKQKFIDYLNHAKKLLDERKYKDSKTVLAKAEALPGADKKACEELKKKIDEKSGAGGLFGGDKDFSDGKDLTPGKSTLSAPAKSGETEEQPEEEEE